MCWGVGLGLGIKDPGSISETEPGEGGLDEALDCLERCEEDIAPQIPLETETWGEGLSFSVVCFLVKQSDMTKCPRIECLWKVFASLKV